MSKIDDSIKKYGDGALLYLYVTPRADDPIFPSGYNVWRKKIEIRVSSDTKDNKANMDVIKTVALYFGKSTKDVIIVSGGKNREKTLFIKDILVDNVVNKLRKSLDGL